MPESRFPKFRKIYENFVRWRVEHDSIKKSPGKRSSWFDFNFEMPKKKLSLIGNRGSKIEGQDGSPQNVRGSIMNLKPQSVGFALPEEGPAKGGVLELGDVKVDINVEPSVDFKCGNIGRSVKVNLKACTDLKIITLGDVVNGSFELPENCQATVFTCGKFEIKHFEQVLNLQNLKHLRMGTFEGKHIYTLNFPELETLTCKGVANDSVLILTNCPKLSRVIIEGPLDGGIQFPPGLNKLEVEDFTATLDVIYCGNLTSFKARTMGPGAQVGFPKSITVVNIECVAEGARLDLEKCDALEIVSVDNVNGMVILSEKLKNFEPCNIGPQGCLDASKSAVESLRLGMFDGKVLWPHGLKKLAIGTVNVDLDLSDCKNLEEFTAGAIEAPVKLSEKVRHIECRSIGVSGCSDARESVAESLHIGVFDGKTLWPHKLKELTIDTVNVELDLSNCNFLTTFKATNEINKRVLLPHSVVNIECGRISDGGCLDASLTKIKALEILGLEGGLELPDSLEELTIEAIYLEKNLNLRLYKIKTLKVLLLMSGELFVPSELQFLELGYISKISKVDLTQQNESMRLEVTDAKLIEMVNKPFKDMSPEEIKNSQGPILLSSKKYGQIKGVFPETANVQWV